VAAHLLEQHPRALGIRDRGGRDHDCQEQAQGVNQQMTLAARDHLASVVAAYAPHARGFDTLAVQTAGRGMLMTAGTAAEFCAQGVVNALPGSVIAPDAKVSVDALPLRVVLWQHTPLSASDQNIEDRVDDLAHVQATWSTTLFGGRHQIFDTIPVAVEQIGRVCLCVHTPSLPYPLT
jgi:hypothetical protein